ncbi:hypothetical protein VaNZ11_008422, partial [Volvox africanus]
KLVEMINALARLFGQPPVEWDAETLGCDPSLSSLPVKDQRAFADAMSEVAAWLTSPTNQDEFLVLYLDNQPDLQAWGRVDSLLGQAWPPCRWSLLFPLSSPLRLRSSTTSNRNG